MRSARRVPRRQVRAPRAEPDACGRGLRQPFGSGAGRACGRVGAAEPVRRGGRGPGQRSATVGASGYRAAAPAGHVDLRPRPGHQPGRERDVVAGAEAPGPARRGPLVRVAAALEARVERPQPAVRQVADRVDGERARRLVAPRRAAGDADAGAGTVRVALRVRVARAGLELLPASRVEVGGSTTRGGRRSPGGTATRSGSASTRSRRTACRRAGRHAVRGPRAARPRRPPAPRCPPASCRRAGSPPASRRGGPRRCRRSPGAPGARRVPSARSPPRPSTAARGRCSRRRAR